jgi:hypothetical protein
MIDEKIALPPIPQARVNFADHSYPAYSAKQMEEYARAAILAYESAKPKEAEGELERDAARYRHMRSSFVRTGSDKHDLRWFLSRRSPLTAEGLDADIDRAMLSAAGER